MRRLLAALILLAALVCMLIPSVSFTEDRDTVLLARTIYALAGHDSYDAKLAVGSLVMNRVDDPWFSGDLGEVLRDPQQFPAGSRYDDESLRAAHAVLSGRRTLRAEALYYQSADASAPWDSTYLLGSAGGINFYARSGNL